MSIRLAKSFRPGVARVRARLEGRERMLFDLLCSAGELGYRLPADDIKLRAATGVRDPRKRLAAEFASLRRGGLKSSRTEEWQRASDRLARLLVKELDVNDISEEDRGLRVLLAYSTIALAPDCVVPKDCLSKAAWDTAVKVFARLFPSDVKALGPLELVQNRLAVLNRECAAGLRKGRLGSGRRPGPEGRKLAVDPQLIALVGKALGKKVAPGYLARYLFYTKPGDHIWPHPDDPKFAVTVLICLRHETSSGDSTRSSFVAYRPDGSIERYDIAPGEALAVEPGLIHAREPVHTGERVALLSIGLCAAAN